VVVLEPSVEPEVVGSSQEANGHLGAEGNADLALEVVAERDLERVPVDTSREASLEDHGFEEG